MTRPIRALAAAALLLAACGDDGGDGPVTGPAPALFSCADGAPAPEVGAATLVEGPAADTLCFPGGAEGAEYLYVPFYVSDLGTARLRLELAGSGFRAPGEPLPGPATEVARFHQPVEDERFHVALRVRERTELTPLFTGARAARPAAARTAAQQAVPQVGDLLSLNTTASCAQVERAAGRVQAVTRTAIVVSDTSNPAGGFTAEDWRFFGQAFDTLVNPVDTENFGEPTDIDENDRVIIFFTRAVNALTRPGSGTYVGGFFWGGDLFPNAECQGSNTAEIFYMLVPDPARAAAGEPAFEPSFVKRVTVGVLGHEYQHLINAGRRLYVNEATSFEEVWLNEGLSHIAEELLFYAATGLSPRGNLGLEEILATQHRRVSFGAYQEANFGRFLQYLQRPDTVSLFGVDDLPTRGASWAFLRYAADQEHGPDAPFFRALVNGTGSGVPNLDAALTGFEALPLIRAWTVSVYTDDAPVPVEPLLTQPSWDFRSIMPAFVGAPSGPYPLDLITPQAGGTRVITLEGGGAAFVRFGVAEGGRAVLRGTSAGAPLPGSVRVSIVRLR